MKHMDWI
jgi:hypothetical protein